MIVRKLTPYDLSEVDQWLVARGGTPIPASHLPATGAIVDGVGAGWLYKTDSNVAMLDAFVTNPAASPEDRGEAIELLCIHLCNIATNDGFADIICTTRSRSISQHAQNQGFRSLGSCELLAKARS